MSRQWRPEWENARSRSVAEPSGGRVVVLLLLGAVVAGLAGAFAWARWTAPAAHADASSIEWNAVQAVPTRAPDPEDVAWEKRAEQDPSSSGGGPGGGDTVNSAADAAGPPPASPTKGEE